GRWAGEQYSRNEKQAESTINECASCTTLARCRHYTAEVQAGWKRRCGKELNEYLNLPEIYVCECLGGEDPAKYMYLPSVAKATSLGVAWQPAIQGNQQCSSSQWWVDYSTPPH